MAKKLNKSILIAIFIFFALTISAQAIGKKKMRSLNPFFWGEPEDHSRFYDAAILKGRDLGLFTFDRVIYQRAKGILAYPDGGPTNYLVDSVYIATYDLNTKEVKIIHEESNVKGKWLNGNGRFSITATFGNKVIVTQDGQIRKDYSSQNDLYWLNIETGELTLLPLNKELAAQNFARGYLTLVDEKGTLILESPTIEEFKTKPNWFANDSVKNLLVRYPDGKLKFIAKHINYHGFKDQEVYYWVKDKGCEIFNIETEQYRLGVRKECVFPEDYYKQLQLDRDLGVYYDKGYKLHEGRKINDKWEYVPLNLTPQQLVPM